MKKLLASVIVISSLCTAACGGASGAVTSPTPSSASPSPVTPETPKSYAIGGMVTAVEKPTRFVKDARVEITSGANAGRFVVSGADGSFALMDLLPGAGTLRVSKTDFQSWSQEFSLDNDLKIAAELFPAPPANQNGATATGRCNDGAWTWAQTLPEACILNGGIAYGVCPGPLCKTR